MEAHDDTIAKLGNGGQVVTYGDDRLGARGNEGLHPLSGLGLKGAVARGQDLIDNENLRLDGRRH